MKVLFFVINYNTDDHVIRLLESIITANKFTNLDINVHVIDNSKKTKDDEDTFRKRVQSKGAFLHSSGDNLGYFGCIPIAQDILKQTDADCVVYCNPDLFLSSDFFVELKSVLNYKGVVAPSIISIEEGFDQNPKYINRLSRFKMCRLKVIFSNSFLYLLYFGIYRFKELLFSIKSKRKHNFSTQMFSIYAPHGAIFIFTDVSFFKNLSPYPCFLFGEEIYIAEEAMRNGINIYYTPGVKVYDSRHASISKLNNNYIRKLHYRSIDYLLKNYY